MARLALSTGSKHGARAALSGSTVTGTGPKKHGSPISQLLPTCKARPLGWACGLGRRLVGLLKGSHLLLQARGGQAARRNCAHAAFPARSERQPSERQPTIARLRLREARLACMRCTDAPS